MNTTNPFNKTLEELTNENMNDTEQYSFASNLNLGELLAPKYQAYDPYPELEKDALKASQGESVQKFADIKDKFVKPKFTDLEPNQTLIDMNIRELENEFERQDDLKNQANFLFNPQEGNTPEERAKSQRINKLLAEIDNFAIQYNLSQRQKEQLKSQVLSQHLGEYISTKQGIEEADLEKERQEAMDLARGRTRNNNPIVRDPETMDDNNMRPDAEGIETIDEGGTGGAASGAGEASTATPNPQGTATGAFEAARIAGDRIIRNLNNNEETEPQKSVKMTIETKNIQTLKSYVSNYDPSKDNLGTTKTGQKFMNYFINTLGLGERLTKQEKKQLRRIIDIVKQRF